MNKIYKVVWNKAKNCYVVASEFVKNHQTGSKRVKSESVVAVMAAAMLTVAGTGIIYAANVTDTDIKNSKETILFENTRDTTTKLNDPNLKHNHPDSWVHGHTDQCGELTYNTTLTIGDINKVADSLVANDNIVYNQGIKNVTMKNGKISLIRNNSKKVDNDIVLTGQGGTDGSDTSVTVKVGDESQTFNTGSVVSANTDNNGKATGLTINGQDYTFKTGKEYREGQNVTIDDNNVISVDLSNYAKTEEIAVVYKDKTQSSLHSTNSSKKVDIDSIALGKNSETDKYSVAIGNEAKVEGRDGVAIGFKSQSSAAGWATAVGGEANAAGSFSVALGNSAKSAGQGSIAIGQNSKSNGADAITIGRNSKANDQQSVAISEEADASGEGSIAFGYKTKTTAQAGIAIGRQAESTEVNGIAFGNSAKVSGMNGMALGEQAHSSKDLAIAIGGQARATGDYSTALGAMTNVDADYDASHTDWRKSGVQSTTIGYGSGSWGDYSTALGAFAKTENQFSSAIGYNSQATAQNAVALGAAAKANVYGGVALGTLSVADREKGVKGAFAPEKINATDQSTWISTAGAVSVGDTEKNITRQITHVAAGREDTDAVNVAQLEQVNENLTNQISQSKVTVSAGKNINVMSKDNGYTVSLDDVVKLGNDKIILDGTTGTIHTTTAGTGVGSENSLDFNENGLVITNNNTGKSTVSGGILTIDGGLANQTKITGAIAEIGDILVNGTSGSSTITGLTNTTTDYNGFATSGRAATEEQLKQVKDTANRAKTTVAAGKNIKVSADEKADGHTEYNVSLDDDITLGNNASDNFVTVSGTKGTIWASHSVSAGNVIMDGDSGTITGLTNTIWNGTTNDASRAATEGQLQQVANAATSNDKRLVQNPNGGDGSYQVKENGDVTLRVEDSNKNGYNVTIKDIASKAELDEVKSDVGNVDGFHDEIKNKGEDGKPTHTSVVDAVNNLDTKVNTIQSDVTKATAEAKKHSSVSTGNGLDLDVTDNDGQKDYKVSLKDDFTIGGKDGQTGNISFKGSAGNITASGTITAGTVSAGNTSISDTGLQIGDKTSLTKNSLTIGGNTYITDKGIDANKQKISNVEDGNISKDSKEAVNGSQLYAANEAIANNYNNITNLNGRISNLDNRVNKVGAGAAALAALHPLDFDPDAKWDFAAGYGNYRGTNAAAVGVYYRPNEDTMFSVGGTFGNGENMVNAGVSFKLGAGSSHVSTSRVAMAKEIKELRSELEAMKSTMLDANAGKKVDTSKLQLFPDVPQNHWAYEYVAQLAGNGMIEGYPDGNFAGDRPMTRYEFAAMLYRAMTKGAVLSDKILSEFSHELEYFTVDTVSKDKTGNPTIQRVRTVKANKNK